MKRKTRKSTVPDEPGVAEVRRWRSRVWLKGGESLPGVAALLRDAQAQAAERGAKIISRKAASPAGKNRGKRRAA